MVQMCRWIPAGSAARCVVSVHRRGKSREAHCGKPRFVATISTNTKTVQKFGNRQKDFRRFLQQQQQQPKRIRSNINVHNKRICFVGLVAAAAGNSPPNTKSSSSSEELRLRHSVHCKQRHGIQTCPTPFFSFFLSFLLSCWLACKPPPPTRTITTLDDVSSQQKRDVQHQIPKPGARVYLFCFCSVASLLSIILCVSLRQKNC
jgi:hypothetical protein